MKKSFWKFAIFGSLANCIFCFLPVGPFMCFMGGFGAAHYFYRKEFIYLGQKPSQSDCFYLTLLSSLFSALLMGYLFTLFFYLNLGKPIEETWLQIEFFENLIRKSSNFKWFFFWFSFLASALSNYIGCLLAFKLGVSKKKPSEQTLLNKLELKDLLKYLE